MFILIKKLCSLKNKLTLLLKIFNSNILQGPYYDLGPLLSDLHILPCSIPKTPLWGKEINTLNLQMKNWSTEGK